MPHLSELHGAATHLAVIAIPVYAVVLMLRRFGPDHQTLRHVEPWLLGAALAGVALVGITGLLVWGQAQTMLRGSHFDIGTVHFWLGIVLAVILVLAAVVRLRTIRQGRPTHAPELLAAGTIALLAVFVQGYLGGRMTYDKGVGINAGGELAQSATGAKRLAVALANGGSEVAAGRAAFAVDGLGCASCHGDRAQGLRGPSLAGGRELADFRGVHGHGLFPPSVVTDRDFKAIDAWLRTLKPSGAGDGDGS
ncbi:MAG: DUF2231 domain-containing protein [Solirubrobacteraceae bacterium]